MKYIKNALYGMGVGLIFSIVVYIGIIILTSTVAFLAWDFHLVLEMFEYETLLFVSRLSILAMLLCGFCNLLDTEY